jgi:prepilin-type N-terminal cleavage/methylation domain-containing protein
MKKNQNIRSRRVDGGSVEFFTPPVSAPQLSTFDARRAFTLIELLVVITIIALLAAFTIPVLHTVARKKMLDRTRGEMEQIETAIDRYKAAYGFYPPSNPNYIPANPATWNNALFNPLYFELLGTTNTNPVNPALGTYQTLDGSAQISAVNLAAVLGVSGFINCTKPGAVEDASAARNFLPDLTPNRIGIGITNVSYTANPVSLLLAAVGGPDQSYRPLGGSGVNPWCYVSPGINSPNSYDLWVQLVISGRTNLICNWSKQVQLNSPLP